MTRVVVQVYLVIGFVMGSFHNVAFPYGPHSIDMHGIRRAFPLTSRTHDPVATTGLQDNATKYVDALSSTGARRRATRTTSSRDRAPPSRTTVFISCSFIGVTSLRRL